MTDEVLLSAQHFNTPDTVGPVVVDASATLHVTVNLDYLPPPPDTAGHVIYIYLLISPQRGPNGPYRSDLQSWVGAAGRTDFDWQNVPAGTWYIDCHYFS